MAIFDLSLPIHPGMTVWPGDPSVQTSLFLSMDKGDPANVTQINMSVHTGTHIDAPHHFLNDKRFVDSLPLDILTGPCYVTQLPDDIDEINADLLERMPIPDGTIRLLFGTRNSHAWANNVIEFQKDFAAISPDGADWLISHGIKLVGVDYLSAAPFDDPAPTHLALLRAGVIIVEGLDLSRVPLGFYELYCLPLKIKSADGAPARVILIG